MHYAIIDNNNQVVSDGSSAQLFPNVSFPDGIPTEDYLKEHNAVHLSVDLEHDSDSQHLIPTEPYEKDGVWYSVEVVNMTDDQKKSHKKASNDFDKIATYTDAGKVKNAK